MIGALVENLFDAFLRPRRSVRRLIDGGHGLDIALQLVLLGFVIREIFISITPGARMFEGAMPLAGYIGGLVEAYVTFGFLAIVVHHVGRLFGGAGTLQGAAMAIAWYLLVISIFTPVIAPAFIQLAEAAIAAAESPGTKPEVPGGAMMALAISSGIMLWLLASYIAELHRFERTWHVLFVVIGLSIPVSILTTSLMPFS